MCNINHENENSQFYQQFILSIMFYFNTNFRCRVIMQKAVLIRQGDISTFVNKL